LGGGPEEATADVEEELAVGVKAPRRRRSSETGVMVDGDPDMLVKSTTAWALALCSPTAAYKALMPGTRRSSATAVRYSTREEAIEAGKDAIAKQLRQAGVPLQSLLTVEYLTAVADDLRVPGINAPSQSRLGPASGAFDVRISMTSPLLSLVSRVTSLPFTLAPIQR
jgi:hypothetical protein